MFIGHLYVVFGEMSVEVFSLFLHWVVFLILSCMSHMHNLEINPLLIVSFAVFSPILRVVFSSCLVSFAV